MEKGSIFTLLDGLTLDHSRTDGPSTGQVKGQKREIYGAGRTEFDAQP